MSGGPRVARRARLPAWPGRCGRQDGRAGAFGAIGRRILSCLRCKLADAGRPLVQGPQRGQSRTPAAAVAVRLRRRDADSVRQGSSHPDIRIHRALPSLLREKSRGDCLERRHSGGDPHQCLQHRCCPRVIHKDFNKLVEQLLAGNHSAPQPHPSLAGSGGRPREVDAVLIWLGDEAMFDLPTDPTLSWRLAL